MHCKDVSVRDVDFSLDEDSISAMMDGWTAYVRTEYLVLRHGDELAVVELRKSGGDGLFRRLESFEIVSLPEDTVFVDDPSLDVLNTPALARLQLAHPGKTVVVRGMFSHINFVKGWSWKGSWWWTTSRRPRRSSGCWWTWPWRRGSSTFP